MGLGGRAFSQKTRGLTSPSARKTSHQYRGARRPLALNLTAHALNIGTNEIDVRHFGPPENQPEYA